jgi:hypothetical protein
MPAFVKRRRKTRKALLSRECESTKTFIPQHRTAASSMAGEVVEGTEDGGGAVARGTLDVETLAGGAVAFLEPHAARATANTNRLKLAVCRGSRERE